jgi:hypothetical protein
MKTPAVLPEVLPAVQGQIHLHRVPRSRAIKRIVSKGVGNWAANWSLLQGRLGRLGPSARANFQAVFQRQGYGHLILCQIEVWIGGQVYRASRIGQNIQAALDECLAHLLPERAEAGYT